MVRYIICMTDDEDDEDADDGVDDSIHKKARWGSDRNDRNL